MELLSPARGRAGSPLKDVTNSTPLAAAAAAAAASPRKITGTKRTKRANSISLANSNNANTATTTSTTTTPPPPTRQRRSTRQSSLKTELRDADDAEAEPQTGRVTRSRRRATPSENMGSVAPARKRSARKEPSSVTSVTSTRRTRRSTSALPSSPLEQKSHSQHMLFTPSRPRLSRTGSSSAKPETANIDSNPITIQVIDETEQETNPLSPSPLRAYTTSQPSEFFATPFKQYPLPTSPRKAITPFKHYPLPASPPKPITPGPNATPSCAKSPLQSFPCLKPSLPENDIFAISPGMFPRKTKHMDFLDILQDTDRKDFQSPIKSPVQKPNVHPPSSPLPEKEEQPEMAVDVDEEVTDELDAEIVQDPEEGVLDTIQEDEEHPHFALLAYLAELASVRDPVPEEPSIEEVTHGSIEDILTAAALAESFQDEIFLTEDVPAPTVDQEDEEVDIMTVMEEMVREPSVHALSSTIETQESTAPRALIEVEVVAEVAEVDPVDELAIDGAAELDDFDAESLISYSEAEITVETSMQQGTQDLQVPLGHSLNDAIVRSVDEAVEEAESTVHPTEMVTLAETVGINESGQFTSPAINIFEDQVIPVDASYSTQSLDHSVIFSFSAKQIVIPSPPKRQASDNQENSFGIKKRKTGPSLPNTTRLDILRKRASRNRSREARLNLKRRDITAALQPILDNLPSPVPKVAVLRHTPALVPPSLVAKRLQSPVTPAPTKRARSQDETPFLKPDFPLQQASPQKETAASPKKHVMIRATPVKATPKMEFRFNIPAVSKDKTPTVSGPPKPTPRYEVYSKIFGPPPQLPTTLLDRDSLPPKSDSTITTTLPPKSPSKKRKDTTDPDPRPPKRKEPGEPPALKPLRKPIRNETFAVPAVPVPPGPPQLPPSIQRGGPGKRFTSLNSGVLPSPAAGVRGGRSSLPRPSSAFGSGLPVPATRRSTRGGSTGVQGKIAPAVPSAVPAVVPTPVVLPEKRTDVVPATPVLPETFPQIENITIDRPKGKLGGAQRVNRNGDPKKEDVPKSSRPTRPPTPPLTSLSQKELKSLTDANTKKNDGFKTVMLQPTVKRINKKRPGEASDDFMVGKESKWSNAEADLPEWTRASPEERSKVKWKSPRFMARAERKGAMRVKGILKKKEKERDEVGDTVVGPAEPLVIQRFVYKGEKL